MLPLSEAEGRKRKALSNEAYSWLGPNQGRPHMLCSRAQTFSWKRQGPLEGFTQRNDRMRWVLESSLWMLCGRYNGRGKNQDKESRWKDIAKWQTRHGQDLTQDHGCWNGKRELAIYQEAESIGLNSAKVIRNNQCRYTTCRVLLYTLCIYEFTQSLQNSVNWAPVSTRIYSEETEVWPANSRARV